MNNYLDIETLVPDIYTLLEQGGAEEPEFKQLAEFGARVTKHIHDSTHSVTTRKLVQERPEWTVYASELGHPCNRHIWFKAVGFRTGGPHLDDISGPNHVRFLYGDVIEEMALTLAEVAGHTVERRQERLSMEHKGVQFRGKIDAVIDNVIVDVKSVSHSMFGNLARKTAWPESYDSYGYRTQLGFYEYVDTMEVPPPPEEQEAVTPRFLAVNKQSGDMKLLRVDEMGYLDRMVSIHERIESVATVVSGASVYFKVPTLPNTTEFTMTGKVQLPTLCSVCAFCPFKRTCFPEVRAVGNVAFPKYVADPTVDLAGVPDVSDQVFGAG